MGLLGNLFGGRKAAVRQRADLFQSFVLDLNDSNPGFNPMSVGIMELHTKKELIGNLYGMAQAFGVSNGLTDEEIDFIAMNAFEKVFALNPRAVLNFKLIISDCLESEEGLEYLAQGASEFMRLMDEVKRDYGI